MDDKVTERVVRGTEMMEATVRQWMEYWHSSSPWEATPEFHVIPTADSLAFEDPKRHDFDDGQRRYRIRVNMSFCAVLDECVALAEKKLDEERQQRLVATHLP